MKDKMELLWDSIVKYSKRNDISIYYSTDVDIVISFEWDKRMGGAAKFLRNAEESGIKSIVISIKRFEDEDMDCSSIDCKKYRGKIAEIDIMYISNDVGYKYHEEADWFSELNTFNIDDLLEENDDKKVLPLTREVNEKSIDSLIQDMLQYFDNEVMDLENGEIDSNIKNFWMDKGINFDFPIDQELKLKIDRVNREARKKIEKNMKSVERQKLMKLIPAVIKEKIGNSNDIISREQLKNYLSDKGITVHTASNIDYMYNQLLKEIKIQNKKY
ncbi:MAG: hypothetical protein RE471_09295 [Ferroplasma sp.]|uniref:hypothetical protein n=1 Tax=Ferroplasma sp. TaxID=2591003 RepID=UPI002815754E|nr:hypothetical protein [Ferroplasma sp.]WMT51159.1 MAG: hypothetical protein RE471_09295 [Ferroplasma sp.]